MKYLTNTEFDKLVAPYHEEFLANLKKFVAINSVNYGDDVSEEYPFGRGVARALDFIKDLAIKDGFKATNYKNMVVEILYGSGEKNITILAHADVVPEGKGWSHDPFTVREKDGVLTGRGVADDKGPLLETYYALKALRDNNLLGDYEIRFIVGGNEESGSLGVEYYFKEVNPKQPTLGFSPDAEWPLIYAEKGITNFKVSGELFLDNIKEMHAGLAANAVAEECVITLEKEDKKLIELFKKEIKDFKVDGLKLTIRGKSAHGSMPQLGVNAALLTFEVLYKYYKDEKLKVLLDGYKDPYGNGLGANYVSKNMDNEQSSMNLGLMNYQDHKLEMVINYRYCDTCPLEEALDNIRKASRPFDIEVLGTSPLLYYDKESVLIKTLYDVYQKETGDYKSKILAIGGGTYAKEAQNIVAFGAEFQGWDSKMHGVLEGSRKADMLKSMAIYAHAILELGKKL